MSIEAIAWAFKIVRLNDPTAKLVLIAVCNYTDDREQAWPSINRICEITDLSRRAVQGALRRLEELKLVTREKRNRADGSESSSVYNVNLAWRGGAANAPPPEQQMHPPCAPPAPTPAQQLRDPCAANAPLEPLLNLKLESSQSKTVRRGKPHARNQGCILPSDWRPKDSHYAKGAELGFNRSQVDAYADRMRNWAGANAHRQVARKSNWDLAFHNWISDKAEKNSLPKPQWNGGIEGVI